ncbi:tRNA 2-thiocytidine(32) synthetase TtcA [Desulfosarcina sp. OttesenSCG-928-A07]|nr:tRNA 2-thiocytidine(32) synthetase TtcA [Desulfosarcina sp. OttesenSCG-928-G17]MDL2328679.1 tRNA 2-thiocytidine(32) synthetase TtcA [Desulfosarcina sp. OttesenSCG-928-A07]
MTRYSHTYKTINRLMGKAISRYDMIRDGDRIAVGVSGGKDSLTLLWALAERQKRIRIGYELFPIYVDPGFPGGMAPALAQTCREMGLSLTVDHGRHGPLAHSPENRENPCFLCSRHRRKRLFEISDGLGIHILALGHTKDDIIETFFLNICYAGEISTMVPRQDFFGGRFSVIRPLSMVDENCIRQFAREQQFPDFVNVCPSAGKTKRSEIKAMLLGLYQSNSKIKGNIYRAMSHVKPEYLLK